MTNDFNWNDLRSFLAVARAGRLTVAARNLGIDHSTLSRRISALETDLRVKLFERRSLGYTLTIEGEELLEEAQEMESMAIGMQARVSNTDLGLAGTVRVGSPEGFGTYFLAPYLGALSSEHPDLEIELVANPRSFSLSKREADVAITMSMPDHGRLLTRKLTDYELGLYASNRYLKLNGPVQSPADLKHHHMISYIDDLLASPELDYLSEVSRRLDPRIRISNIITQSAAVAGNVGVGILPYFIARTHPNLVRLLPDTVKIVRSYWLVTHEDVRELARVRATMDFIVETINLHKSDFWDPSAE
jgi:DNA-binding transcriptional LysR family regulator